MNESPKLSEIPGSPNVFTTQSLHHSPTLSLTLLHLAYRLTYLKEQIFNKIVV